MPPRHPESIGETESGPSAGKTVAGYRLLRLLGRGNQSQVFLAEPPSGSDQLVALKLSVLSTSQGAAAARQAFMDAAQVAQRLQHPHIVAVRGAGVEGALSWLAMEAVPGTNLERYTRAPRLLPEALVLHIAQKLAEALGHAHRQGVIHRDLKPANVLVDWASNTVKLVDFGLARVAGAANTGTGVVLGTPAYMAPEQLAGGLPSSSSDIYALGVLVFELLIGRLPHDARNMGELLQQVAGQTAPCLRSLRPTLPLALETLVASMLAKDPAKRPSDALSVAHGLAAARVDLPGAKP